MATSSDADYLDPMGLEVQYMGPTILIALTTIQKGGPELDGGAPAKPTIRGAT